MKSDIRFTDDDAQILSLWQRVFGDEADYIRFFLERCRYKRCLGRFSGDRLIAMLFLIDCVYDGMNGAYIYAVATDPCYRKQGNMRKLLDYSKDLDYDFLCLAPAEPYLFDVYKKCGFETKLYSFKPGRLLGDERPASFAEYFSHRNAAVSVPYVRLKDERYLYDENIDCCSGRFLMNQAHLVAVRDGSVYEWINRAGNTLDHPVGMIYSKNKVNKGYLGLYMD